MTKKINKLVDELERISSAFEAVGDLISPEPDLHTVRRDRLSCLVSYLAGRERDVTEQVKKYLYEDND